ncbi:MAG TPA: aminotransferase class V-fold PLP-dependent enzyme [Terriglobales bacterium]|nr:aminotransferase class V-fold PLP-dependent enzyme [Terriglobales bacterium]
MLSDAQVSAVRARFPIFRQSVYLNSCSQGALSDAVEGSMRALMDSWDRLGSPWELWVEQYEEVRREFAAFIGADADEVAVVPSVSAGVSSLATALDFAERKTVVMGEFEFPTMGHVWMAQERRGAQVKFLRARDGRMHADEYARAIDQDTAIVPVTGVCFMNGFRSPVREIVAAARAQGAYVLLDDYQDCGTRPRNVRELDVDFYTAGALKYLLGAAGIAFLYARKELISRLQPTVSGWFGQENPFAFATTHFQPASNARRFESGTPPIPSVYMALAGLRLLREVGMENVAEQVRRVARAFLDGAHELGIRSKTPAESVGPLVVLQAKDAAALVTQLAKEGIICSSRHDGLRIAFHVYNTMQDVDLVLRALEKHRDLLVSGPQASHAAR